MLLLFKLYFLFYLSFTLKVEHSLQKIWFKIMEWETHVRTLDLYYRNSKPWFIYFFKVTDTLSQLPCLGEVKKLSKFQTAKEQTLNCQHTTCLDKHFLYNEVTGLLFNCNQIQTMKEATPNYEQGQTEGQAYGMHRSIPKWATLGKHKLSSNKCFNMTSASAPQLPTTF